MSTNAFNILSSSPPSPTMMEGNNNNNAKKKRKKKKKKKINNNNNNNNKKVDSTSMQLVTTTSKSLTIKQRCGILHAGCYMICCKCILCKSKTQNEENEILPIEKSYLLLGCGTCGKSTLLHRFSTLDFNEQLDENSILPTNGFSVKQIKYKHGLLSFWELGGSKRIQKYWPKYVEKELFDGLVYVVDASCITSDGDKMLEATNALKNFLKVVGKSTYQRWYSKTIYIILNKMDLRISSDLNQGKLIEECKTKFHFVNEYFRSSSFFCTTCFATFSSTFNEKNLMRKYKIKDIESDFKNVLNSLLV